MEKGKALKSGILGVFPGFDQLQEFLLAQGMFLKSCLVYKSAEYLKLGF